MPETPRDIECFPGSIAPVTGDYDELNGSGTRTLKRVHVQKGEPLPPAPIGFTWRLVAQSVD
jgi:hypothetical protein